MNRANRRGVNESGSIECEQNELNRNSGIGASSFFGDDNVCDRVRQVETRSARIWRTAIAKLEIRSLKIV